MRQFILFVCAVLGFVGSAGATTWQVQVQNFEFVPAVLTISQGDTVVWTNVQGTHNVMQACGSPLFGNTVGDAPWVYEFVFDIPVGDYPYHCEVHPDLMLGVISVGAVPQRWDVTVQSYSFTPSNLTVQQGDTIVWTNILGTHDVHHNATPSLFGNSIAGAPWTYTFVANLPAGNYPYICEVHPSLMQGNITVTGSEVSPAPGSVVLQATNDFAALHWPSVQGVNCYLIYLSEDSASPLFTQLVGITSDTTFVKPALSLPGSRYFFQIRAVNN